MTVVALLSVAPVKEGSMAADVADAVAALDEFTWPTRRIRWGR
jgi:hypothetical protein